MEVPRSKIMRRSIVKYDLKSTLIQVFLAICTSSLLVSCQFPSEQDKNAHQTPAAPTSTSLASPTHSPSVTPTFSPAADLVVSLNDSSNNTIEDPPTPSITIASQVILMTGFEPFGGRSINSSWESVSKLDGAELIEGFKIVAVQLPVNWDRADDILREAIDLYQPILVINVGQGVHQSISLELNAKNHNGTIPDNASSLADSEVISEKGPDTYISDLELDLMLDALIETSIPARISTSAGSYLCNFVSYHSYDYLSEVNPAARTFFVHVPPVDSAAERTQISIIIKALEIITTEATKQLPH